MTVPQHLTALQHAQEIRLARAALKREVRSYTGPGGVVVARAKLAVLVGEQAREVQSMPVVDLLGWAPRMPHDTILRYLDVCGISEFRTVEQLTDRQRLKLAALLGAEPGRRSDLDALRAAESEAQIASWARARHDDSSSTGRCAA